MTRTGLRLLALSLSIGLGFGLSSSACVLPNPNHCQNLAIDPNAWCSVYYEERPYCSPCTAENNGCVSEEPSEDECPEYTPRPDTETDTGETDAETETGDATETDTGAETETETG